MNIRHVAVAALLFATTPVFCAANTLPATAHADHGIDHGIDWQTGHVDAAFALAKANNKPLFLYAEHKRKTQTQDTNGTA